MRVLSSVVDNLEAIQSFIKVVVYIPLLNIHQVDVHVSITSLDRSIIYSLSVKHNKLGSIERQCLNKGVCKRRNKE